MLFNIVTNLVLIAIPCLIVVSGSTHDSVIETGCHNDGDCKEFVKINQVANSTCLNHHCICRDSDFNTIACLPEKQGLANVIGGKCPCSNLPWSSCIDGLCKCQPGYVASKDNWSCIPNKLPIGSRCENDAQCSKQIAVAKCVNNTCSCSENFTARNGTCHSPIVPDKNTSNSICVADQCYCEPGYVAAFDRSVCLPNVDFNGNCSESVQCQHNLGLRSVCEQGKCICQENSVRVSFNDTDGMKAICEERVAIGQKCIYDTDCFQSHFNGTEQSMYCSKEKCECAQDYELDEYQRICIKSKVADLQNTWLDSLMAKVSSAFATSSGNRSTITHFRNVSMLIICLVLFL